jgi:hypothetical protein
MLSPEKMRLADTFLARVSKQIDQCVARAVEVDRRADGETLKHDMSLGRLGSAPRRIVGAERTPTPLRLFCLPFEDLFTGFPRNGVKQIGRIARSSVAPIWNWVGQALLPLETRIYCRDFKSASAAGDHARCKALAANFWPIAGAAMHSALAGESSRRAARQVMKSELVLADAQEAALLLAIAPAVMKIQEILIKPVPMLTDEQLCSLCVIRDDLGVSNPNAAPYVALIAMNRLARPPEALKLTDTLP